MKPDRTHALFTKGSKPGIQRLSRAFKQYKTRTAWGFDIDGHALKAVKITQTAEGLLIEDFGIIEYPDLSSNINFLQSLHIKDVVQAFLAKHHITKTDRVLASIPGQLVLSRFTTIPPADKKQLKNIISYEAKQQIPFDLKDVVWDYQQLSEPVPDAEGIEVGLFASKRTTLDHLMANLTPVKAKLTTLQVSPLAIYNYVFFDQQTNGTTVIINVEDENTDLIIVSGLHFWLRSIPLYTIDADLIKEVQRSMEYYKSLTKETVHFQTILLMGNTKDPRSFEFITSNLPYELKILKTLNNLRLANTIDSSYFRENLTNLATAIGLALQGLGLSRININLLPPELIRAVEMSKKKPYAMAALGCLALSLIVQYGGLHMKINQLHHSNNYHQKVLQNIRKFESDYRNAETIAQTRRSALDLISSIDSSRFFWIEALDKLLSTLPDDISIISIQSSWVDADTIKTERIGKQTSTGFFQAKKTAAKTDIPSKKLLLMGIKGESKEPSISFIEKFVIKPIQNLTFLDQKVIAFKNVEIVPGSCRQVKHGSEQEDYISFEIRWIVKSQDEIQTEIELLSLASGTSTSPEKL